MAIALWLAAGTEPAASLVIALATIATDATRHSVRADASSAWDMCDCEVERAFAAVQ